MSKFINLTSKEKAPPEASTALSDALKEAGVKYDILQSIPTWPLKEQEVFSYKTCYHDS